MNVPICTDVSAAEPSAIAAPPYNVAICDWYIWARRSSSPSGIRSSHATLRTPRASRSALIRAVSAALSNAAASFSAFRAAFSASPSPILSPTFGPASAVAAAGATGVSGSAVWPQATTSAISATDERYRIDFIRINIGSARWLRQQVSSVQTVTLLQKGRRPATGGTPPRLAPYRSTAPPATPPAMCRDQSAPAQYPPATRHTAPPPLGLRSAGSHE